MLCEEQSALALPFAEPLAILGVEGIYDLVALRDNHAEEPYYQRMVENVFGVDEVSPCTNNLHKAAARDLSDCMMFTNSAGLVESLFPCLR